MSSWPDHLLVDSFQRELEEAMSFPTSIRTTTHTVSPGVLILPLGMRDGITHVNLGNSA